MSEVVGDSPKWSKIIGSHSELSELAGGVELGRSPDHATVPLDEERQNLSTKQLRLPSTPFSPPHHALSQSVHQTVHQMLCIRCRASDGASDAVHQSVHQSVHQYPTLFTRTPGNYLIN